MRVMQPAARVPASPTLAGVGQGAVEAYQAMRPFGVSRRRSARARSLACRPRARTCADRQCRARGAVPGRRLSACAPFARPSSAFGSTARQRSRLSPAGLGTTRPLGCSPSSTGRVGATLVKDPVAPARRAVAGTGEATSPAGAGVDTGFALSRLPRYDISDRLAHNDVNRVLRARNHPSVRLSDCSSQVADGRGAGLSVPAPRSPEAPVRGSHAVTTAARLWGDDRSASGPLWVRPSHPLLPVPPRVGAR